MHQMYCLFVCAVAPSSSVVQQAESTTADQPMHSIVATSQTLAQDGSSLLGHDARLGRISHQAPAASHVSSVAVLLAAEEPSSSAVGTAFPMQSQAMPATSDEPGPSHSALGSGEQVAGTQQSAVSSGQQQAAVTSSALGRVLRVTKRQHEPEEEAT